MEKNLREHFKKFLEKVFEEGDFEKHILTEDEDGFPVTQKILYERQRLFEEINRLRDEDGLPPVEKKQVNQADTLATGHIDFFSKLVTYSVELTRDGKLHPSSYW